MRLHWQTVKDVASLCTGIAGIGSSNLQDPADKLEVADGWVIYPDFSVALSHHHLSPVLYHLFFNEIIQFS